MRLGYFKLSASFATDPKMQRMSEANQRRYLMLRCLQANGTLHTLKHGDIAYVLRISEDELSDTKIIFMEAGLITPNWEICAIYGNRPPSNVWAAIRDRIFARDDYTCKYCGKRAGRLECDHIHPLALGGGHEDENLTTACFECNRSKRDKTVDEWKKNG